MDLKTRGVISSNGLTCQVLCNILYSSYFVRWLRFQCHKSWMIVTTYHTEILTIVQDTKYMKYCITLDSFPPCIPQHHVPTNTLTVHFCHVRLQNVRPLRLMIPKDFGSYAQIRLHLAKNEQDITAFHVEKFTPCQGTNGMRCLPLIQSLGHHNPLSHHRSLCLSQQPFIWSRRVPHIAQHQTECILQHVDNFLKFDPKCSDMQPLGAVLDIGPQWGATGTPAEILSRTETTLYMQPDVGTAKKMTGILIGAETIDQHGKSFILVVPDVSVYDPGVSDSLISAGRGLQRDP